MSIRHIRISQRLEKGSEIAAIVAVLIGTALFISELIFHFPHWMHEVIGTFELVLCSVFFFEVSVHLINAPKKRHYLRSNWFYILTITPFTKIFSSLGIGAKFAKAAHLLAHSNKVAHGAKEMRLFNPLLAREAGVVLYHLRKCRFDEIPKTMRFAYANTYISPHADRQVTDGILEEVKEYCRKHYKVFMVFKERDFIDAFRIEQELQKEEYDFIPASDYINKLTEKPRKNWNIVITDHKVVDRYLQVYGKFTLVDKKGFAVFSTDTLHRSHPYEHIDPEAFRKHRGRTIAKHILDDYTIGKQRILTPRQVDVQSYRSYLGAAV